VPAAFYHFAFEAGTEAGLAAKRDQLRAKGLEVTDIVDHGWAKSIYFSDPNGLSLEYCCLVRDLTEDDAVMQERGTIPLARLGFKNTAGADLTRVPSTRGKVMA
jgi:Glyoxalase/Bleomycin resistance protein/Dioxygenase superfamily